MDVGEFGENLYDEAKASDWTKAAAKYQDLQKAAKQLAADLKGADARLRRHDRGVTALGRAVTAKDRMAAMRQANQVTLIAADLNEPFKPQIPSAVTRLDAFGRELEMGAEAKDQGQIQARRSPACGKTGIRSRPRCGPRARHRVQHALTTQVGAAKTIEDYAKVAKPTWTRWTTSKKCSRSERGPVPIREKQP